MPRFHVVVALAAMSLLASACGGPEIEEDLMSWEEFRATAYKEDFEGGKYIINGDEPLETEEELESYYYAHYLGDEGTSEDGLAVRHVNNKDVIWPTDLRRKLTYCIKKSSFGANYSKVVSAMKSAAAAWEATAGVNFIHVIKYDTNCTPSQSNVLFDVSMVREQPYLARAFAPSTTRSAHTLRINTSAFANQSPLTLTGILRHELGHVLGFRHEHIRKKQSDKDCVEDKSWRGVTEYDAYSVMHYPWCLGKQTGDLVLTGKDKTGARRLYP